MRPRTLMFYLVALFGLGLGLVSVVDPALGGFVMGLSMGWSVCFVWIALEIAGNPEWLNR